MKARYLTADVFTDRRFGGNQLAVFPDAREISSDLMPRIAREFNYSETTFVLPPTDPSHTARVRIFTPGGELQFAGHPTIGTAIRSIVLAADDNGLVDRAEALLMAADRAQHVAEVVQPALAAGRDVGPGRLRR